MRILKLLLLAAAALAAWLLLRPSPPERPAPEAPKGASQVWTCSMHPQIRLPGAGKCPICGMDLTPAASAGTGDGTVSLGEEARRVASLATEGVRRRILEREIRTVGRIDYAEPLVAHLTARTDARVERLYADFTGTTVAKGDHLVDVYSPDLLLAQEELLAARGSPPAVLDATRRKLLLWGITEAQVEAVLKEGRSSPTLTLHAPIGGTVIRKEVRVGQYVKTGDVFYTIADLSRVWLYAEVYEADLPWIEIGQEAVVEAEGVPGESFRGTVAFVDPSVAEATRTVRVRVNLANPARLLKPGMFAKALIRARLGPDGRKAPSPLAGKLTCPMHPEVAAEEPGDCRICGMPLVRIPGRPEPGGSVWTCPMHPEIRRDAPGECERCGGMKLVEERAPAGDETLAVPASAVLDTGTRRVAWVELEPGRYQIRVLALGPKAGDFYPVLSGLADGEKVVVKGNFLLDSQAQIEGKPSLLYPEGIEAP